MKTFEGGRTGTELEVAKNSSRKDYFGFSGRCGPRGGGRVLKKIVCEGGGGGEKRGNRWFLWVAKFTPSWRTENDCEWTWNLKGVLFGWVKGYLRNR